jgi:hypothetical protein
LVSASALLGCIAIVVVIGESGKTVGRGGRLTSRGRRRHLGVIFLVFVGIVTAAAGPFFLTIDLKGLVFDLPSPLAFFLSGWVSTFAFG